MAVMIPLVAGGLGAWAGGAVGIGSAAGWAIGSAVGSAIESTAFAPKVPQNTLSDLSVQTASWGAGLPQVFGEQRVAGNIIWSTDKQLVGGTQGKFGGKGGSGWFGGGGKKGGGSQGYYQVSLAIALCEGPIGGIKRIWSGADLIFDDGNPVYVPQTNPNDPNPGTYQNFISVNQAETSNGYSSIGPWILYHGTTTQTPDPTIVANGSGNGVNGVPYTQVTLQNGFEYTYGAPAYGKLGTGCAYRGVAYIVFNNMYLGYTGTIPPLTFEVISAGATNPISLISPYKLLTSYSVSPMQFAVDSAFTKIVTVDGRLDSYSCIQSFDVKTGTTTTTYNGIVFPPNPSASVVPTTVAFNATGGRFEYAFADYSIGYSPVAGGGANMAAVTNTSTGDSSSGTYAGTAVWFFGNPSGHIYSAEDLSGQLSTVPHYSITTIYTYPEAPVGGWTRTLPAIGSSIYWLGASTGRLIAFHGNGNAVYVSSSAMGNSRIYTDGSFLYYLHPLGTGSSKTYNLMTFDTGGAGLSVNRILQLPANSDIHSICFYNNDVFGALTFTGGNSLCKFNADGTVRYNITVPFQFTYYDMIPVANGIALFGPSGASTFDFGFSLYSGGDTSISATNPTIADVISATCDRAGLLHYDVSLLPAKTISMTRPAGTPARDILSMLTKLFAIDMVDSAGTLKFVPKGQSISAVLGIEDIGFAKVTSGTIPAPYSFTRAQGTDLPRQVVLKYVAQTANYNQTAVDYQIYNPDGRDITANVPVTLDWGTAFNAVYQMCVAPHIERTAYTWTTSFKWAGVEPGDVLQMPWGVTRVTDIAIKDAQNTPIIEMKGVIDATYVMNTGYGTAQAVPTPTLAGLASTPIPLPPTSTPITGTPPAGGSTTPVATPPGKPVTNPGVAYASYFEIPPVKSSQTAPFYMVSAYSSGNAFIGAAVFESTDNGTTYNQIGQQAQSGVVGFIGSMASTTNSTPFYTWDDASVINVYLNSTYMTLSSATDLQVLNGANLALVGSFELIQFVNANLMTDANGVPYYQLSRLLRGRFGTEFATGNHTNGSQFILIQDNDEVLVNYNLTQIINQNKYKIATFGQDISAVSVTNFAIQGYWYKGRTPTHVNWTKDSSNNWTLTFYPRARFNTSLASGLTPSLDSDIQTWSIQIHYGTNANIGGGTVLRTYVGQLTAPTWQYTAAMQTADGLTPGQSGVYYLITQLSTYGPVGTSWPVIGPIAVGLELNTFY